MPPIEHGPGVSAAPRTVFTHSLSSTINICPVDGKQIIMFYCLSLLFEPRLQRLGPMLGGSHLSVFIPVLSENRPVRTGDENRHENPTKGLHWR
jgi:hypothetical protein